MDELEHFRFHDAWILAQERTDGNLVWILKALNVTTLFSGCDFETDRQITQARLTFEDARVLSVDVGTPDGLRRADADESERLTAAIGIEQTGIFDLYQDAPHCATAEILCGSACGLRVLKVEYARVLIEWDAYAGQAWYLEPRSDA